MKKTYETPIIEIEKFDEVKISTDSYTSTLGDDIMGNGNPYTWTF